MILSNSPWGLSELWGGGVPTSDIDHSGPRIRRSLIRTVINPPVPPLLPSDVSSPPSSSSVLPPYSARDHLLTRASPVPVPANRENSVPSPLSPVTTRVRIFRPSLALTTPATFLSPPLPRCCQNIFYRGLQLPFRGCLTPPLPALPPPALVPRLFRTILKY